MKTTTGAALLELQRTVFARAGELDRTEPGDVAELVGAIVSHLRAWRPESVAPLGVLPPPGGSIRDPRIGDAVGDSRTMP